jgi:steroid delta-isomerase-like uncharacterized protein
MPSRQKGEETLPGNNLLLDVRNADRAARVTDLDSPGDQSGGLFATAHLDHFQPDSRPPLCERVDLRGKNLVGRSRGIPDRQHPALAPSDPGGLVEESLRLRDEQARALLKKATGLGQGHPTAVPLEETRSDALFEGADLNAQGRLTDVEASGGAAEVQLLGEDIEGSKEPMLERVRATHIKTVSHVPKIILDAIRCSFYAPFMKDTMKRVIEDYFHELFNQGRLELVDELLHEAYVNFSPGSPDLPRGRDGVRVVVSALRSAFPDLTYTIEDMVLDTSAVAVRTTMRGTHLGDFFGLAATGRRFSVAQMTIERFRDDKIVEHHRVTDEASLMRQLAS